MILNKLFDLFHFLKNADVLTLNRCCTFENKYSNLTIDKKRQYIDNVVNSRRKKRLNECESSTSTKLEKANTVWLLKALVHEGKTKFNFFIHIYEVSRNCVLFFYLYNIVFVYFFVRSITC